MTLAQTNAAAFASTPVASIDAERRHAVTRATGLITAGEPGRALYVMARSVQRQALIAGCGTHAIESREIGGES